MLRLAAVAVLSVAVFLGLEALAAYVVARNALRSRVPGPLEPRGDWGSPDERGDNWGCWP